MNLIDKTNIPLYQEVRLAIYDYFLDHARAPSPANVAVLLDLPEDLIIANFRLLQEKHLVFLDPQNLFVQMAWPLSGVVTDYRATVAGKVLHANCAWDMFGIPAMLDADAVLDGRCAQSGEWLTMHITIGQLVDPTGFIHFLVPPRYWFDDIVHT